MNKLPIFLYFHNSLKIIKLQQSSSILDFLPFYTIEITYRPFQISPVSGRITSWRTADALRHAIRRI